MCRKKKLGKRLLSTLGLTFVYLVVKVYFLVHDLYAAFMWWFLDPLSSYPSFKQLNKLRVEQWFQLGFYFGLSGNQLKSLKNNDNPTADTLVSAKAKNIDLKWVRIVQGLLNIGDYKLAESVCSQQGNSISIVLLPSYM